MLVIIAIIILATPKLAVLPDSSVSALSSSDAQQVRTIIVQELRNIFGDNNRVPNISGEISENTSNKFFNMSSGKYESPYFSLAAIAGITAVDYVKHFFDEACKI